VLLTLQPEYQGLLASGNLRPSEATELARLTPRGQATLFQRHPVRRCQNYNDLRLTANALVRVEAQLVLMPAEPPPPSDEDRRLASGFEASVERIALMLRTLPALIPLMLGIDPAHCAFGQLRAEFPGAFVPIPLEPLACQVHVCPASTLPAMTSSA
jgi:hypothetical protein